MRSKVLELGNKALKVSMMCRRLLVKIAYVGKMLRW